MSLLISLHLPHFLIPLSTSAIDKAFGILHASFGRVLITFQLIDSVMQGPEEWLIMNSQWSFSPTLYHVEGLVWHFEVYLAVFLNQTLEEENFSSYYKKSLLPEWLIAVEFKFFKSWTDFCSHLFNFICKDELYVLFVSCAFLRSTHYTGTNTSCLSPRQNACLHWLTSAWPSASQVTPSGTSSAC